MDFLYKMIFLGLMNPAHTSKIPRWVRLFTAVLVSIIVIGIFSGLSIYVVFAAHQSMGNRILVALFMLMIASYYVHLIKGINR